jgi:hypothetical protein
MEHAMRQAAAANDPTLKMFKASFKDRGASIVRVAFTTGTILAVGQNTISSAFGLQSGLWLDIAMLTGIPLIVGGTIAAGWKARNIGFAGFGLFLMLPGNLYTLAAGSFVAAAYLFTMSLFGNGVSLSAKQWGELGVFLWIFTYYIGGLCILFWPKRNGETGAASLGDTVAGARSPD